MTIEALLMSIYYINNLFIIYSSITIIYLSISIYICTHTYFFLMITHGILLYIKLELHFKLQETNKMIFFPQILNILDMLSQNI